MTDRRTRQADALLRRLDRASQPLDADTLSRPALVCAPHPDDETIGCGGTIATKRAAGAAVTIVVASRGDRSHAHLIGAEELAAIRAAEVRAACAVLGVGEPVLLDLPDGRLAEHVDSATARIAELLASTSIEQVFVPFHAEGVPDHVATRAAALAAIRAVGRTVEVFEYPVWFWTQVPARRRGFGLRGRLRRLVDRVRTVAPRALGELVHHVDVGPLLDVKRRALAEHRSQTTRLVDDPRWLTLADVEDGHLLRMAMRPRERFARLRPTASPN